MVGNMNRHTDDLTPHTMPLESPCIARAASSADLPTPLNATVSEFLGTVERVEARAVLCDLER